jgi:hypothetical protein
MEYYIDFEKYWDDEHNVHDTFCCRTIQELSNWIQYNTLHPQDVWYPTKDTAIASVSFRDCRSDAYFYVHQIKKRTVVIFSDGRYTGGIKYISPNMLEWFRKQNSVKAAPKYNFGEAELS